MIESTETDKLIVITHIIDKLIDKLPDDKVDKIKKMKVVWKTNDDNGYELDNSIPELEISFHK